jgi:hypothetical protein
MLLCVDRYMEVKIAPHRIENSNQAPYLVMLKSHIIILRIHWSSENNRGTEKFEGMDEDVWSYCCGINACLARGHADVSL